MSTERLFQINHSILPDGKDAEILDQREGEWNSRTGPRRYYADRNDECATRRREDRNPKPWDAYDIERYERTARRLRAMALLADVAECDRAGQVDWLDMRNPAQTRDEEDAAVALAEAIYRWRTQA